MNQTQKSLAAMILWTSELDIAPTEIGDSRHIVGTADVTFLINYINICNGSFTPAHADPNYVTNYLKLGSCKIIATILRGLFASLSPAIQQYLLDYAPILRMHLANMLKYTFTFQIKQSPLLIRLFKATSWNLPTTLTAGDTFKEYSFSSWMTEPPMPTSMTIFTEQYTDPTGNVYDGTYLELIETKPVKYANIDAISCFKNEKEHILCPATYRFIGTRTIIYSGRNFLVFRLEAVGFGLALDIASYDVRASPKYMWIGGNTSHAAAVYTITARRRTHGGLGTQHIKKTLRSAETVEMLKSALSISPAVIELIRDAQIQYDIKNINFEDLDSATIEPPAYDYQDLPTEPLNQIRSYLSNKSKTFAKASDPLALLLHDYYLLHEQTEVNLLKILTDFESGRYIHDIAEGWYLGGGRNDYHKLNNEYEQYSETKADYLKLKSQYQKTV